MKTKRRIFFTGFACIVAFVLWTILMQVIDVQNIGVNGTKVGFATLNNWFHSFTGVNMTLYTITDWLGLVPIFICMFFCMFGFVQLIKRKSLLKVDFSLVILGVYYIIIILCYLTFEIISINYRPILINGFMEASYPSSTTLLVLCVMPTLVLQVNRRLENDRIRRITSILTILFSLFMVIGRLISGVHWITDIIGSILLSTGLFCIYKSVVMLTDKEKL
jgi:undecaprenyl-diphosphatase